MNKTLFVGISLFYFLPLHGQVDTLMGKNLRGISIVAERSEVFRTGSRKDLTDSLLKVAFNSLPLAGLLDASSGLVVHSYGPGVLASSSLRGGNAQQTALTWNGMTLNSPVNGQIDLNLIQSFLFEEVALLPGMNGSLQGSGAVSGGIALNSTTLRKHGFSIEAQQSAGSFGRIGSGLKLNHSTKRWTQQSRIFISQVNNAYAFRNYTEPGHPIQKLKNAKGSGFTGLHETGYFSKRTGSFKLSYWLSSADREIPPTLLMQDSEADQKDVTHRILGSWDRDFKMVLLKLRSFYQNDFLQYQNAPQRTHSISQSFFLSHDAEMRFKFFKHSNTAMGLVQTHAKANVTNYDPSDTSLLNQSTRNQWVLWMSHIQRLNRLRSELSASVRREIIDGHAIPFMACVGFKTFVNKNFSVYGQINKVYRIPTLNDLHWAPGGNPDLKPEFGWCREMTLDFQKTKNKLSSYLAITTYHREIHNWIIWQPVSNTVWSPFNIGKVVSQGMEWRSKLNFQWTAKLSGIVMFNFDYIQSQNREKSSVNYEKQLLYVPSYKSSGFIGFIYRQTKVLVQSQFTGLRYIDSDNDASLPNYLVLNVMGSHQLELQQFTLNTFLRLHNVLNTTYESVAYRPMPGFNFELGLNLLIKSFKRTP